jgi:hypothetical protein
MDRSFGVGVAGMASSEGVKPGDVLLFHGKSFVAWAIRAFDGTVVNHAALALEPDLLGEAAGNGLQTASISGSTRASRFTIVRRHASGLDASPVVQRAQAYLAAGVPYAYHQILLLAILSLTRRIPLSPVSRRLVRAALDEAAGVLNAMVESGRQVMICSEYVFRCYNEAHAGPGPNPYRLEIIRAEFAEGGTLVDWALDRDDATLPPPAAVGLTFGSPADETVADTSAEERLAPLIAAYAAETGSADDLPPVAVPPTFALDQSDVSDEELLQAIVTFSVLFADTTDATGVSGTTLGREDPRDSMERVRALSVDPNFVTPGDLLRTVSLVDRVRIEGS